MANSLKIGFQLSNFAEMKAMVAGLPAAMQSRVLGDAVKVASRHIVKEAKQRASVRTGALRRSITAIVRRYPNSGQIVAVIGPDTDYYEGTKRVKSSDSKIGKDRPASYAHLVEFGHRTAVGGTLTDQHELTLRVSKDKNGRTIKRWVKGALKKRATGRAGKFISAKPFIRPAVSAALPAVNASLGRSVEIGMERELKRMARKLKRFG